MSCRERVEQAWRHPSSDCKRAQDAGPMRLREELLKARFERMDPPSLWQLVSSSSQQAPAPAPQAQNTLPPKKRTRQSSAQG